MDRPAVTQEALSVGSRSTLPKSIRRRAHAVGAPRTEVTYESVSPRYAISIEMRQQQDPTAEWTVFRANLSNQLKSTGLSLSWKNAHGLRDGKIFTYWESTSGDVAKNILSFLSKDTTLARLNDRNVISLTFHQHCTAFLSAENFRSYIDKRGQTTVFRCFNSVSGNISQKAGPSTVPKTVNNPPDREPNPSITQSHPTTVRNRLGETSNGRSVGHPSRSILNANAEYQSRPIPVYHAPRSSNGVSSDAREGFLPAFLPHPSLPHRPGPVHVAVPITAQPLRISTSGHSPSAPQPSKPSSLVTSSPTSLKRSAAALDCVESRDLAKRAKLEGGEALPHGREIRQLGAAQIKKARSGLEEERKQPSTSSAEKKSLQRQKQQKKHETVNELQTKLKEAQGALRKVQEGNDKAKRYVQELDVALEKARRSERSLMDENARLTDAGRSALEARRIAEQAQKAAEEMQKISEGKQRETEEMLSSERLSRLAAEQALLDVTSVFHGVNIFTHLKTRLQ